MAKTDDDSEKTLANLSLAIEKLRIEVKSGAERNAPSWNACATRVSNWLSQKRGSAASCG